MVLFQIHCDFFCLLIKKLTLYDPVVTISTCPAPGLSFMLCYLENLEGTGTHHYGRIVQILYLKIIDL